MGHAALSDEVLDIMDISSQIASANVNGLTIDTAGWDGIRYVFVVGTMASGATFDARLVSSANANMSGNTNVTATINGVAAASMAITQLTNASNANMAVLDLYKPTNRYVRSATIPATANSTFSSLCQLYRRSSGTNPPTANANTIQVVKGVQN